MSRKHILPSAITKVVAGISTSFCLTMTGSGEPKPIALPKEAEAMKSLNTAYFEPLQKWMKSLPGALYFPPDRKEIGCCGLGDHGHWSLQTNTTTFAALAVLATDPALNETEVGMSRAELREKALKLLRFTLRTHAAGTEKTLDGKSWGLSWISPLCLERMMHGIEALDEFLTPDDRLALRNMMISESDWQMDHIPVLGGIDATKGKNKPESNIWSGCLLFRTAIMYPDAPRRKEYLEKANKFILNGISVPADAKSEEMIAGKPLKDWHVGPNFTENYGLNHHGYLNVGYMVICMSNIAMLHFSCKSKGIAAPEALYHHVPELWRMIKLCTFNDGRLWRIGGDTRVRYCYCQDYVIPMWMLMKDKYGENTTAIEQAWLKQVSIEQKGNKDGSFFGNRLQELEEASPLYYHRLEGDRAAALSMGIYWNRKYPELMQGKNNSTPSLGGWQDKFHGAMVEKGERRAASWVWKAAQKPSGMCLPTQASDLAEWRWNLTGEIIGMGAFNYAEIIAHQDAKFSGGFRTAGRLAWHSDKHIAEGQADEITALEDLAVFALPDDATMVIFQRATTENRTILKSVKGLFYNVPNDVFNGYRRNYGFNNQTTMIKGMSPKAEVIALGHDVTIDKQVKISGIYGIDALSLYRPGRRQVDLVKHDASIGRSGGNLYCDEICHPCITTRHEYPAKTMLFDQAFAVSIGAEGNQAEALNTGNNEVKAIKIKGADGKSYVAAVNFAKIPVKYSNHPVLGSRTMDPLETVLLTLK